jgi:hypothetical protein
LHSLAALAAISAVCQGSQAAEDHVSRARQEIVRDPSAKSWGRLGHATIMHVAATNRTECSARTPGHAAEGWLQPASGDVTFGESVLPWLTITE